MAEEIVELTRKEFDDLPEYSCTLPTGVEIGKQWKRNEDAYQGRQSVISAAEEKITGIPANWWLGTYAECVPPEPGRVAIHWKKIRLKESP